MPKPKYYTYFSFANEEPSVEFTEDTSPESAIKRAEIILERGHRPNGDFIDSAWVYRVEYDIEDECYWPVGDPIWQDGEPFGPIDAEDATN